jgi:hypothetical protein
LTIARYYTPSGRCIQKPYEKGNDAEYEMDIITLTNWTDIIRNTNHTNGNVIDILLNIFRELLSDIWFSRETIQCLINRLGILNDITVVDGINEVRILTEHRS